jgi:hypothetical protein
MMSNRPDAIRAMFTNLRNEASIIVDSLIELAYFMRGSIDYHNLLMYTSYAERTAMEVFVKKRLEAESKSAHPVY